VGVRFGRLERAGHIMPTLRRAGSIETVTEQDSWDERHLASSLERAFNAASGPASRHHDSGKRYGKNDKRIFSAAKTGDITSARATAPSKAGMDALTKTLARQLARLWDQRERGQRRMPSKTDMSANGPPEKR